MRTRANRIDSSDTKVNSREGTEIPPRRAIHPSNKLQLTKLFYLTLFLIFLVLTAGLVFWGMNRTGTN